MGSMEVRAGRRQALGLRARARYMAASATFPDAPRARINRCRVARRSRRHPGDRFAVGAVERDGDADPLAVVAADLKPVRAPAQIRPIDREPATMSALMPPANSSPWGCGRRPRRFRAVWGLAWAARLVLAAPSASEIALTALAPSGRR